MSAEHASRALAALVETGLAGAVAIVLVLLLRRVVRQRFGAGLGYALWLLVPLAMLAVLIPAGARPQAMSAITVVVPAWPDAIATTASVFAPGPAVGLGMVIWLLGVLAMMARLVRQQCRFVNSLGRIVVEPSGLLRADGTVGLPEDADHRRQRIVLPNDFEARFDAGQRLLVLEHERIHVARGDTRINVLVAVLRCLHWFNPVLHWAVARFREDQELSCDARVVAAHPEARRRYAEAMLKTHLTDAALPLGCHWSGLGRSSSFPLKERIAMLKNPIPSKARCAAGSALLAALGAMTALSAAAVDVGGGAASAVSEDVGYRHMAPPHYPADALSRREQGDVVLRVLVAIDGSPHRIELESSSGSESIDAAAIAAVEHWRFNPGKRDGVPVEGWVLVPISFQLSDPGAPTAASTGEGGIAALDGIHVRPGVDRLR